MTMVVVMVADTLWLPEPTVAWLEMGVEVKRIRRMKVATIRIVMIERIKMGFHTSSPVTATTVAATAAAVDRNVVEKRTAADATTIAQHTKVRSSLQAK
uniref:Putative secreted protein n=1 Tax=Anopheles darlingi TaxID=43151 RepID=A0A2M4DIA6_ANODA